MQSLISQDPAVANAVLRELGRQEYGLEMIASENYVSEAVLEAQGSVLTNKYAEGLPHKRYYGGCEFVDIVEDLARDRAKQLFGCDMVNVQPHSGAQANMAVYLAAVSPGDTIMGMDLTNGGHLTHGSHVNFSGTLYKSVSYGVNVETGRIDWDDVRAQAHKHKPKMIICGASAYPREIPFAKFREIADEVGALLLADIAHVAGLVVTGLHDDPVPHCDFVTTTTHKTLRGPRGGMIMGTKQWGKKINKAVFPGMQGGPLMHVIAAKAVAFGEALQPAFKVYAQRVIKNAQAMGSAMSDSGLDLVSGGTDNHLVMVSLLGRDLTGKAAEAALGKAHITVNKNTVPGETRSPFVTSGLRIGTPALTSRGMGPEELTQIGGWIGEILALPDDDGLQARIGAEVKTLCERFPLYPGRLAAGQAALGV